MMISDAIVSSVIEGLLILSKEKLKDSELLTEANTETVTYLSDAIRLGEAFTDDFHKAETTSELWCSIIRAVEGQRLLGDPTSKNREDLSSICSKLAVHIQRLLGALFSISELVVQGNTQNAAFVIASIRRLLGSEYPNSDLLQVFQDYRSYFPYSYMFARRLGRTPNTPASVWKDQLDIAQSASAADIQNTEVEEFDNDAADDSATSDLIRRSDQNKAKSVLTKGRSALSDDEDNTFIGGGGERGDARWLVSDSEEGEDSDDDEVVPTRRHRHQTNHNKRMTRMSASPARRAGSAASSFKPGSVVQEEVKVKSTPLEQPSHDDIEIQDISFSSDIAPKVPADALLQRDIHKAAPDIGELSSIHKASAGWTSASSAVSTTASGNNSGSQKKSLIVDISTPKQNTHQRPSSTNSVNSFDESDTDDKVKKTVLSTISASSRDYQKIFEESMSFPGAKTANQQTLSRNIRYFFGDDELAGRVLLASGPQLSWKEFSAIANIQEPPPRVSSDLAIGGQTDTKSYGGGTKVSIPADSPVMKPDKRTTASPLRHHAKVPSGKDANHPNSHDEADRIEMAIELFSKIDANDDGVVSHIELIKALRSDQKLAKALKLPSHIRQEDGTRDSYMARFNEIDRDATGNISLQEFLQFLSSSWGEREDKGDDRGSTDPNRSQRITTGESPAAPASVPRRLADSSDKSLHPNGYGERTLAASVNKPPGRSVTDQDKHEGRDTIGRTLAIKSNVYRRSDRGTDFKSEDSTPNHHASHALSIRTSGDMNQSFEAHAGPLSAKHRRLVGGESVGTDTVHLPSKEKNNAVSSEKPEKVEMVELEKSSPPVRPPLNPNFLRLDSVVSVAAPETLRKPRSEFAEATSTIFEGYLDKKSQILGLWQKRYFVLTKSHNRPGGNASSASLTSPSKSRAELRIYTKAVMSAWGMLPIQLRRVVPLIAMESIDAIPDKKKIGTLFKIVENIISKPSSRSPSPAKRTRSNNDVNNPDADDRNSDNGSVMSDLFSDGKRIVTLRSSSPEERLEWITVLRTEVERVDL